MNELNVVANILKANEEQSKINKKRLDEKLIYTINLMGAPGSGRTALLEKLIARLKLDLRIAVIEGDLFTVMDAQKFEAHGIPVVQVNTRGGCHLDARMLQRAMNELDLDSLDLLMIENVGNLACPAEFGLGEDTIMTVLSTTEGSDKPLKYPLIFEKSKAVVVNKMDLLEYTNFNTKKFYHEVKSINEATSFFQTSCRDDLGFDELCDWLKMRVKEKQEGKKSRF